MSGLIHLKDRGVMMPFKIKGCVKCSKCGLKVRKTQIHQKYEEGILEIPI